MPTPIAIRRRRGTTAQHASFVGLDGRDHRRYHQAHRCRARRHHARRLRGAREPADESGKTYQMAVRNGALVLIEQ